VDETTACHMSSREQGKMVALLVVPVKAGYYEIVKLFVASLAWVQSAKCHSLDVSYRQGWVCPELGR